MADDITGSTDATSASPAVSCTGIGWFFSATGGITILHGVTVAATDVPVCTRSATNKSSALASLSTMHAEPVQPATTLTFTTRSPRTA